MKKPTQWNSTLPNRKSRLRSRSPGGRQNGIARRTPMRERNEERMTRRDAEYRRKLAAARRGEGYRLAKQRAGGRCEVESLASIRCQRREPQFPIHGHHKTYARFGGDELPEDFTFCCGPCHAVLEQRHPTRRKWWAK